MEIKTVLSIAILLVLGLLICCYCIFGKYGIIAYDKLFKKIHIEHQQINCLTKKIKTTQKKLIRYQDPFEVEKIARYDFCMGYTNELIYVLPKKRDRCITHTIDLFS